MASIIAPTITSSTNNREFGIDIVAVIDRSGSMCDGKLILVQETLDFMTKQLQAKDRLALGTSMISQ